MGGKNYGTIAVVPYGAIDREQLSGVTHTKGIVCLFCRLWSGNARYGDVLTTSCNVFRELDDLE